VDSYDKRYEEMLKHQLDKTVTDCGYCAHI